jgi:hypothetical protein
MIQELDAVVLNRDVPAHGLTKGDVGAVVHCYSDHEAFEVEFVTAEGKTVAVLTLTEKDIRPMRPSEILHARQIPPLRPNRYCEFGQEM